MSSFPLIECPHDIVEKIINRLRGDSYFLLQQTCQTINQLVRSSRTVRGWNRGFDFSWSENDEGSGELKAQDIDLESLYGVRNCEIDPMDITHIVQYFDALRKHRITCEYLRLANVPSSGWTKERCEALLKILKPERCHMNSEGSDRFLALLSTKTVKKVMIEMDAEDTICELEKLLKRFEVLDLWIKDLQRENTERVLNCIHSILQIHWALSPQSVYSFRVLVTSSMWIPPPLKTILQKFRDFHPIQLLIGNQMWDDEEYKFTLRYPRAPPGTTYYLRVYHHGLEIRYMDELNIDALVFD